MSHDADGLTEKMINDDPHVKCSIMFGRGKFQNGVLIEPTEDYVFDPSDVKKLEAYRNKIWCVPALLAVPRKYRANCNRVQAHS